MKSEKLRENFIQLLQSEFPKVQYNNVKLKSGKLRISPYVPNKNRNKRWMQLQVNANSFSIAMDHQPGEITMNDLDKLGLYIGTHRKNSNIRMTEGNDALNITIFCNDPYDFQNENVIDFLHKHYKSYLKRVDVFE